MMLRRQQGRSSGPLFSVVIPTYNRASDVSRAIQSVLGQSWDDFEIIVVDDGSTDRTKEVVAALKDERIRFVQQENAGGSAARNQGVQRSTGVFVTFLDSDDEAMPRWLEFFADVVQAEAPAVVRCGVIHVRGDGVVRRIAFPGSPGNFHDWVNGFLPGTYALRRDLFEEAGAFHSRFSFGEHTELAMRLWRLRAQQGWTAVAVQRPLVRKNWSGGDARHGEARVRMAEYVLRNHKDLLSQHSNVYSTYLGFVGVQRAKAGDFPTGRKYLWAAWRVSPWRPKGTARLVASLIPPLGRLGWSRGASSTSLRESEVALSVLSDQVAGLNGPRANGARPAPVSVILPVHNGEGTLAAQMEALANQTYRGPWEVIVADNGSTDRSREVAQEFASRVPSLRVVNASERQGVSHACNVGVRVATGSLLAFCEQDDVVMETWLEGLVDAASDYDAVGGAFDTRRLNSPAARAGRLVPIDALPGSRGSFLPFAQGANCCVWRDVYLRVGGRHEGFRVGGDVEFSWRLQLCGFRLGFAPEAVVAYRLRSGLPALARQLWGYGLDEVQLYRDFRGAGMHRRSVGLVLKTWGWTLLHMPSLLRNGASRRAWLRVAVRSLSLLRGSVRHRVLYL